MTILKRRARGKLTFQCVCVLVRQQLCQSLGHEYLMSYEN